MKPKTIISFSIIFLLICISLAIADDQAPLVRTNLIVNEQTLAEWGYGTKEYGEKAQQEWEVSKFGKANISYQNVKSIKEVPDWPNAYYRFTILKEEYPSDKAASSRLGDLKVIPKGMESKEFSEYILRKGFVESSSVYIISTDVLKFEMEELPRVFQLLKEHIVSNKNP